MIDQATTNPETAARPRLRIHFGPDARLGPGKVELLEAIRTSGSIAAAARSMGMSYRRAWLLVDDINRLFGKAAVATAAGGSHGGGATLTAFGTELVEAYRRAEARTAEAVREEFRPLLAP